MRILKYGMIAASLLLSLPAAAEDFKFGTFNYPPYEFEQDGKATGIITDLVTEGMKRMGHTVKIELYPFSRLIDNAKSGEIDGMFSVFRTPEREVFLDFGHEVAMPQVVSLFVPADSKLAFDGDLTKLANNSIGVVNKVSYGKTFDAAATDGTLKKLEGVNDIDVNMNKLLNGRLDAVANNKLGAIYLLNKLGGKDKVRELTPPLDSVPSYVAFTKAKDMSALRDGLDAQFKAMRADGTFDKIVKSYVGN